MTLTQAADFRAECDALHAVLSDLREADWDLVTQFKGWTFNDVVGHLHMFDRAAALTVQDPTEFADLIGGVVAALERGESMRDCTRRWLGRFRGAELLERWRGTSIELARLYGGLDPKQRLAWAGPDMSAKSCISARQMETWAHGQAIFDALGLTRIEHDRIKNIAVMGVNTFSWTFLNRGLIVPEVRPHIRLVAPSGAQWEWNDCRSDESVVGTAVDFCRVVTQTRNVADTSLTITGPVAREWMALAQCFAGVPESPPAPGERFCVVPLATSPSGARRDP